MVALLHVRARLICLIGMNDLFHFYCGARVNNFATAPHPHLEINFSESPPPFELIWSFEFFPMIQIDRRDLCTKKDPLESLIYRAINRPSKIVMSALFRHKSHNGEVELSGGIKRPL